MRSSTVVDIDNRNDALDLFYHLYPQLFEKQTSGWKEILKAAQFIDVPSNSLLAEAGSTCNNFMLLLEGTVRVFQHAEDGREMTLYRIAPGDICLMSLNSLIHDKPFRANARADTDIKMIMFSGADFHRAMRISDPFRNMMLSNLVSTICIMVQSFYDTAFEPLDMRLACLLGRLFERSGDNAIEVTHQELSQELGTSREVVSRLLKKLEQQECIRLRRGQIILGENRVMPNMVT